MQEPRLREGLINLAGSLYLLAKKKAVGKSEVTLLNYHRISGGSFRKHLDHIRLHYRVLSPKAFFDWLDDETVVDKPSVVFTFDDGYRSFYEEIYPVLRETGTPVFMFISTGFIGKSSYFWADELQVAAEKSNVRAITVDGRKFYLYSKVYRSDFYVKIQEYVRVLDEESRRETCHGILRQLNVRLSESDLERYRFLNWPEILEMDRSGLVLFGSHSVNHPNLATLSDDALRRELVESKRVLEDHLEKPVLAFAYPYGDPACINGETVAELEKAGYRCAFTTVQGAVHEKEKNRFVLKRVLLFDYQNEGAVALKLGKYGS